MAKASDHADDCMICALGAFASELQKWFRAGGDARLSDARLMDFTPMDAFGKVLAHLAEMQERGETQHLH